jgi:hypothetical protein
MNWDAMGAVGEWVGGLATIGTLFYLAHQVRQNTRTARSAAYQAAASSISEWTNLVFSDQAIAEKIATAMVDPDTLDAATRARVGMAFNSLFRNYENIFYQWYEGAISDGVWEGWSHQIRGIFWSAGAQSWWPTWRLQCHADFRTFLENSSPPEEEIRVWDPGPGS